MIVQEQQLQLKPEEYFSADEQLTKFFDAGPGTGTTRAMSINRVKISTVNESQERTRSSKNKDA